MLKNILVVVSLIFSVSLYAKDTQVAIEKTAIFDQTNPHSLTKKVLSTVFQMIKDRKVEIYKDSDVLKEIIRNEVTPYVNTRYSAFYVLGSHVKKATKEERAYFSDNFKEYFTHSFARMFSLYKGQKVVFEPYKKSNGKTSQITMRILNSGAKDTKMTLKLRISKKTKKWYAYDLSVEGISMLSSKRKEFANIIRKKGIDYAVEIMNKSSNKKIIIVDENIL
jgi:phospholipid transport system substrate-binding protein